MALSVQPGSVRDTWFTPSLTGNCDCDVVFVGDSQFRYISEHISNANPNFVPNVCFRSGAKVEDLSTDHIAHFFSQITHACVIHVGTNNLPLDGEFLIETGVMDFLCVTDHNYYCKQIVPRVCYHRVANEI